MKEQKCNCCKEPIYIPIFFNEKDLCWGCYDEYSSIFLGKKIFVTSEVENES